MASPLIQQIRASTDDGERERLLNSLAQILFTAPGQPADPTFAQHDFVVLCGLQLDESSIVSGWLLRTLSELCRREDIYSVESIRIITSKIETVDHTTTKEAITAACIALPVALDFIRKNPHEGSSRALWDDVQEMQKIILRELESNYVSIKLAALRFLQVVIVSCSRPSPAPGFRNVARSTMSGQLQQRLAPTFQLDRVPSGHPILQPEALMKRAEELCRVHICERLQSLVDPPTTTTSSGALGGLSSSGSNVSIISALMNISSMILQTRTQFTSMLVKALADYYQDYSDPPSRFERKSLAHTIQATMDAILRYDLGAETLLLAQCRSGRIARGRKARELEAKRRIPQPFGASLTGQGPAGPGVPGTGLLGVMGVTGSMKPVLAAPPSLLGNLQVSEALVRLINGLLARLAKPNSNLYSGFALLARLAAELPLEDAALERLLELIEAASHTAPGKGLALMWINSEYNNYWLKRQRLIPSSQAAKTTTTSSSSSSSTTIATTSVAMTAATTTTTTTATTTVASSATSSKPSSSSFHGESTPNLASTSSAGDGPSTTSSMAIDNLQAVVHSHFARYARVTELCLEKMVNSEHLPSLILDLPQLTDFVFTFLSEKVRNSRSPDLYLTALKDLASSRPVYRTRALQLLLDFTKDEILQTKLVTRLKELMWYPPLAEKILDYVQAQLEAILEDPDVIRREEELKLADTLSGSDLPGTKPTEQPLTPIQVNMLVNKYLYLYLGLFSERPELLFGAVDIYSKIHAEELRAGISRSIMFRVRSVGVDHPVVLRLVVDHPPNTDKLALELCEANGPTPAMTRAVIDAAKEDRLDGKFVACVFPGMTKEEVLAFLPKLLGLPEATLKHITSATMARTPGFPITPEELLIQLHITKGPNGVEALKESAIWIGFLFTDPSQALLKPDTLFPALLTLAQTSPLPILFFRTLLLSLNHLRSMESYALNLLGRPEILDKQIWNDPRHRQGFINTCEKLLPLSIPLILNLPLDRFELILQSKPNIKEAIKIRIAQGQAIPFEKQHLFHPPKEETMVTS